jgi:hypothetical protein
VIDRQLNIAGRIPGIADWEAAKGSSRKLSHHEAVLECGQLSDQYCEMWLHMAVVTVKVEAVLRALRAKKIPFVLTGAHGIGAWTGVPRATYDVDILVKAGRNYLRAVNAVKALYPELEVRQFAGVTAFFRQGEHRSVLDVTYPMRSDIEDTLATAIWVSKGPNRYRIPSLEAALANKYGAMLTVTRNADKRAQDAIDFYRIVKHSTEEGQQPIDLLKLEALGEKVWPGGGGDEILGLVQQARAGKVPDTGTPRE